MECEQRCHKNPFSEVTVKCNNNSICSCFSGNNWWWILIVILLLCNCGNGNNGCGNDCRGNWNNGCDNSCGCC